jgi:prolyl oligopeptidase
MIIPEIDSRNQTTRSRAGGFSGKKKEKNLYFSFTNYITPGSIFSLDTQGTSIMKKKVDFNTDLYESNKCFIPPRTDQNPRLSPTKGLKLDGTNPTMLYGWRIQREFNTKFQYCQCRLDGKRRRLCHPTYAVVNTEKKWHDAGTKMQKQNVFDDFIAAAEYLIAQKYTSSQYLSHSWWVKRRFVSRCYHDATTRANESRF